MNESLFFSVEFTSPDILCEAGFHIYSAAAKASDVLDDVATCPSVHYF